MDSGYSGYSGYVADGHERLAFAPPKQPGLLRAFALAVIAHLLLLLALMHGLQWKRETQNAIAEAELWSTLPQEAAPREVVPPPPPPVVKAPPQPEPPPVVKAPEPPVQRDADIAIERDRRKRELEKKKLAEERALEKKLQAQAEREQRRKLEAQKKRDEELARRQDEAKREKAQLAADARRKDEDKRRKQEQDTKKVAQIREENMKRLAGLAGTGAPTATGAAARSSGPSANWAGKVQDLVMPKITFVRDTSPSWITDVEVRMAPNGAIISRRVVKPSGSKDWDDAVLAALDKAERLPLDDGRAPTPVVIAFRPRR